MSRSSLFVIALGLVAINFSAQQFQAVYGFPNVTPSSGTVAPSPVPAVPGLSCGTFSAFGVSSNPNASGRFSFTGWPVGAANGADNYATYTAALSPFSYYEFCLTPQTGYTLNLSSLSFSVRRSGTGIRNYCVRTSMDGFAANVSASTGTNTNLQIIPDDVFFWRYDNTSTTSDQRGSQVHFDGNFAKIINPLYIRLYAWNSEAAGGSFSIDDVTLIGEMVDSVLLSGIDTHLGASCSLWIAGDLIGSDCVLDELQLLSSDGRLVKHWINPPQYIPVSELDEGIYVALFRSAKVHFRKKMLLHR